MSGFLEEMEKRGVENSDQLYDSVNESLEYAVQLIQENQERIRILQAENDVILLKIKNGSFAVNLMSKSVLSKL